VEEMAPWPAALETVIGLSAAFNSLYFLLYLLGERRRPPYRVAAGALLLVCLGPLAESVLLLTAGGHGWGQGGPLWGWVRGLALVGMVAISLLILRRTVSLGGE
jgi:hypothetical protein